MNRLDLLTAKRTRSCCNCENMNFSAFAEFCGICGHPIQAGLRGLRRIIYPTNIQMDRYKRVLSCPVCRTGRFNSSGDRCDRCGTYIFNYCISYFDDNSNECSFANVGNSRFCEMCGKPSYYNEKGLLQPWYETNNYSCISEEKAEYAYYL